MRCSCVGHRANLSMISGNDKTLGFVVLGEVLVVFPQSDPSVPLYLVHTCVGCCQSFLVGPQISVDGETLGCCWDKQGMQVQRTLVLRMSLSVGFWHCGIWVFHNPTDHCTEFTRSMHRRWTFDCAVFMTFVVF